MHPLTVGVAISSEGVRSHVRAYLRTLGIRIVVDQATPLETLQVKRLNLDLLLIDGNQGEPLEETVRRIKLISPASMVAVVDEAPSADSILAAMRAGADEFVLPPVEEKLSAIVHRVSAQIANREAARRPPGKVMGFVSAQGGCGSTTVACHVASELARITGNDVLLADFDLEAGLVGFLTKAPLQYSVLDAVKNLHRLDASLWKAMVTRFRPGLDVMPSPNGLPVPGTFSPAHLRETFRLVRSMYSWVAVDLGRALNPIVVALLEDLDEIYLVTTPAITALFQAKQIVRRVQEAGYPTRRVHLVLNRVHRRNAVPLEDLRISLGIPVCAELPERSELDEAYTSGRLLGNSSELGRGFSALAARVAEKQDERPKSWVASIFSAKREQPGYLGI